MQITEIIALTTISGTMLALVGFVLGNARIESKRRGRIYERMGEEVIETARQYVRKDVHAIEYKTLKDDVLEIKGDVKKLLVKNGIS